MPYANSVSEASASEAVKQTYDRIKEHFATSEVPAIFLPFGSNEAFLKDVYMNSKKFIFSEGKLDQKTKYVIAFAISAYAKSSPFKEFFAEQGKKHGLDDQVFTDICALVGANSLYNTFFKFRDLSGTDIFSGMPVGLRAHVFHGTVFDDKTVELINTAISNINACKPCTSGHVTKCKNLGLSDEAILEAIQCAATTYSMTQFYSAAGI